MGIRESLGKIKERILNRGKQQTGNGESRTMTKDEVEKREYRSRRKAKVSTTKWQPNPPKKEKPVGRVRGWLEKKAEEERIKKKRRDEQKLKYEKLESKYFEKGVTDYYQSRGRRAGYASAKARNQKTEFPILGEPGPFAKKLAKNVNANPLMVDILGGKQSIRGASQAKSNKRRKPTIRVVVVQGGKTKTKGRKKKRKKKPDIWNFVGS